ncbi:NADH peroxidase [bacterium BMS3Abin03]|nr:NADH peroxidase [bacterium BMS3Abin03]
MKPDRIIVVGGNAAGPAAAAKAKRVNPSAQVIMFEAGNYISTGTCEIPYVISGEIKDYEDIVYFSAASFKESKGVDVYVNHIVEDIKRKEKIVVVRDLIDNSIKEFSYDTLVLTTGSTARLIPGFDKEYKNIFTLKNISDLIKAENYISLESVKKAIIIGSGYIGIEACEAMNKLGLEVTLLEKEPLPLPTAEKEISEKVVGILKSSSITFLSSIPPVEPIVKNEKIIAVKMDEKIIETDLAIIAIGFKPNTYLAQKAKLEISKKGTIKVDRKLRTSDRNIFAAGDNIEFVNRITNKPDYFPLATYARSFGHIAGENAAGGNVNAEPVIRNVSVKIFDSFYASVGITGKEAEFYGIGFSSVTAEVRNLVNVMPGSRKVFGKIIFNRENKKILGASFLGGREVSGYADLLSSLIYLSQPINMLEMIDYNYTPPLSPFTNLLYVLSRKSGKKSN